MFSSIAAVRFLPVHSTSRLPDSNESKIKNKCHVYYNSYDSYKYISIEMRNKKTNTVTLSKYTINDFLKIHPPPLT